MKTDDPRFTAYVFHELSPDDEARVLQEMEGDEALAAEADSLRQFGESLRTELRRESSEALTPEQRAAILGETLPEQSSVVAPPVAWWRSPWLLPSAAAIVIAGFASAIYFQAKHIERLTAERVSMHELAQGATLVDQAAETTLADSGEGENPDAAVKLEITAPHALALTSDHYPVLKPWNPQPESVIRKDFTGPMEAPTSEVVVTPPTEITSLTEPIPPPGKTILDPKVLMASKTAVGQTMPYRRGAGVDVAYNGVKGRGAPSSASGIRPDYDSASASTSTPPREPEIREGELERERERDKRLTPAERKARKELKDLQARLESLEKRQRLESKKEPKDPSLSQTIEHVRRTLAALQAAQDGQSSTEAYDSIRDNPFLAVKDNQLSTFSVDVDTASYANVRRFLESNQRPPRGAVRIEELLNYFRYDYPLPAGNDPFSCVTEVATCPWAPEHRLVRVGIKGREIAKNQRPSANLVFLVDVSGSMAPENKLPLIKQCLRLLADQLGPQDSVAIAVYAGASGCVLEPTNDMAKVRAALDRLEAGGSTNGAAGIQLAYDLAQRAFKRGSSNRVILCTDGDFNVGISDQSQLVSLVQAKAKTGVFLSVLGFGFGNLKDSTLEKLADTGNGTYGYVDSLAEGRRIFVEQMTGSLVTIAKDVKLQVEFNPARVASYRLIGYENRLLSKEDFNDDQKDAGDIGAGHTVTALYEIVPIGTEAPELPVIDELKYGPRVAEQAPQSPELLTVKVRYKQPDGDASTKLEFPLTDAGTTWEASTRDFRWAAAVAGFGMMLRDSPHRGSLSWSLVRELTEEGQTEKDSADRAAFVRLVEKARALSR